MRIALNEKAGSANEQVAVVLGQVFAEWKDEDWKIFYDNYKLLHQNPGKSGHEQYAANMANLLLQSVKAGNNLSDGEFFIRQNIGGSQTGDVPDFGPSVVGVLKNGDGPVVLLRADMDALPVTEQTGLDYQSTIPGNMHACGHDLHTATLMAATKALAGARSLWSGTMIACFQPSEESGSGALGMIKGGLYGPKYGIPTPHYVFGGHVTPELTETISLTKGTAYSRSDSWKIVFKGRGGHGSRPEATIDPIAMTAYAITRLQTVVSRVVPSQEAGVLTVGEMNGGMAENIIPNSAYIKVNTRANSDELAETMEEHIRQIADAEASASIPPGAVDPPLGPNPEYHDISHLPLLKNEDKIAEDVAHVFRGVFGNQFIYPVDGVSGSEDFAVLARSDPNSSKTDIPYCYWRYGSTDRKRWAEYGGNVDSVPSNHNSKFYPQCDETDPNDPLKVGAKALCAAALSKFNLSPN